MFTMRFDITVGDWRLGMVEKVEVRRSVEQLSDTAVITLPGAEYNVALDVEQKIHRGDRVVINLGYEEVGMVQEFEGWLQRIGTDNGAIILECEDDLFRFRKSIPDAQLKNVSLSSLLDLVIAGVGGGFKVDCSYSWTYEKFVINSATGFDVLKKVQEESGADIYIEGDTLHVHGPGEKVGNTVIYDFFQNVQDCDLTYRRTEDRRVRVVVKALLPDGKVKEREYGTTGGDSVTVKCATSDDESMRLRGESEHKRLTFDGYDGNIVTWLVPYIKPGDTAELHDRDYQYKDGSYYVKAVETTFSAAGGARTVELGYRMKKTCNRSRDLYATSRRPSDRRRSPSTRASSPRWRESRVPSPSAPRTYPESGSAPPRRRTTRRSCWYRASVPPSSSAPFPEISPSSQCCLSTP